MKNEQTETIEAAVEAEAAAPEAVIIPFDVSEADAPEPQDVQPERRTWPCAEAEKDLLEAAGEVLDAAQATFNQASARHNARFQTAVNRTREKVDDMPEINTERGPKFFLVGFKDGQWREIFQSELSRG